MSALTCRSCQHCKQSSNDWLGRENHLECAEGIQGLPKKQDECPLFLYEPGTDEKEVA